MRVLSLVSLFSVIAVSPGTASQIQCYQCEEMTQNDCTSPEYIVNCTVNVQDTCQGEVLIKADGIHYRKSCASSGACLIASSGYQQFCTGELNSVCITCCDTPLCNGPKSKRRPPSSSAPPTPAPRLTWMGSLPQHHRTFSIVTSLQEGMASPPPSPPHIDPLLILIFGSPLDRSVL
ncbi:ly6/PLAUR domain-containing protein 1-like [Engraulis encrasicolus]|uniref:ly6/PLAUR domain-containing protein 1-like n=1 Tax=Engraulis encrasicolus TaxID=184585 RepID=UPI002FCEF051